MILYPLTKTNMKFLAYITKIWDYNYFLQLVVPADLLTNTELCDTDKRRLMIAII